MNPEPPRAAGFTLLEMLVVLLIAGMALALTTQALGQYQRAHARVSAAAQAGREYRLAESWLRGAIAGLIAVEDNRLPGASTWRRDEEKPAVFAGRSDGFHGMTLSPVLAGQGIPTRQSWRIVRAATGKDVLELVEGDATLSLPMPGDGPLRFHYLDEKGRSHPQWPPAQGAWPQLPAVVALDLGPGAQGRGATLVAAVTGLRDPLVLPYEPEPY